MKQVKFRIRKRKLCLQCRLCTVGLWGGFWCKSFQMTPLFEICWKSMCKAPKKWFWEFCLSGSKWGREGSVQLQLGRGREREDGAEDEEDEGEAEAIGAEGEEDQGEVKVIFNKETLSYCPQNSEYSYLMTKCLTQTMVNGNISSDIYFNFGNHQIHSF